MKLRPWQVQVCAVLLARRRADDGTPATRYALWSVARGAGKTGLVVALLEWLLSTGEDMELCAVATNQMKANIINGRIANADDDLVVVLICKVPRMPKKTCSPP
jgi:phage terminase large subunit-like protein